MAYSIKERFRLWRDHLRTRIQRYTYSKLNFDALTKKAEALLEKKKKDTTQRIFARPNYYPKHGWFRRTMMSIGNGLLLYCSLLATFLPLSRDYWGGWYLLSLPLAMVLFCIFCHTIRPLIREMKQIGMSDGDDPVSVLRVIFFPFIESILFIFWNIGPRCYHAVSFMADFLKSSREMKRSERPNQEEIIRSIPQVVVEIVYEELDRLFGVKSSYERIRSEITSRLDSARNTRAYFERRIHSLNPEQISERFSYVLERAQASCEKFEHELRRLESWKAAIGAELNAYCKKVNEISPELGDIVHYRELDRLEKDIILLREEAEKEVAHRTMEILSNISNRCIHLNSTLHEAGVRTALVSATSSDPEKNAVIIAETIDALYVGEPKFDLVRATE